MWSNFLAAALQAVSWSRDVEPILAFHCNGCHGGASGLTTASYEGLMAGGNMGRSVAPGDGDASLLVQFVDGRRGRMRMPLNAEPLAPDRIRTIKRWIDDGAVRDEGPPPLLRTARARVRKGRALVVRCVTPGRAYVTIRVLDSQGRLLHAMEHAIDGKAEWALNAGAGWTRWVRAVAAFRYTEAATLQVE